MKKAIQLTGGNGIQIQYDGLKLALDPTWKTDANLTFVSHAHLDHVSRNPGPGPVIASEETIQLIRSRGYQLPKVIEKHEMVELYDSGHILGSRGILIDGEIFYTGDIAGRPRAFLCKGKVPKARILVVESTYGKPEFKFPSIERVVKKTTEIIEESHSKNRPVVIMGYPLGKSQVLTSLFQKYAPIYLHGSVANANQNCRELGLKLPQFEAYTDAREEKKLEKKDWILISPIYSGRSAFLKNLRGRYNATTISFTGWALHSSYKYAMAVDYALPLSDHCDFGELLELVKQCDPEEVHVTHGFTGEFAAHLTRLGYEATPLNWRQRPLSDFMGAE